MKINQIHKMDVFDFLNKEVKDESVDLAIVDPPYNLSKAEWDTFKSQEAFLQFTYDWIDAMLPKIKATGSFYIFNTPYNAAHILCFLSSRGMHFQNWIVWDKRDGLASAKRKYVNGQESILFFSKAQKHIFNHDDIRVPYNSTDRMAHAAKKGIIKNGKRWYPNPNGKLCGEVWHFSSERHKRKVNGRVVKMDHLSPKPVAMIERMVKASSSQGDLVLDCFMGSGTTAVVSAKLGRNFIGCEKDPDYHAVCQRNLKEAGVSLKKKPRKMQLSSKEKRTGALPLKAA